MTEILDKAPVVSMYLVVDHENVTASDAKLVRFSSPVDPNSKQTLRLVEDSGTLDFWAEESEDGYSIADGEAI